MLKEAADQEVVFCPNACGVKVTRKNLPDHLQVCARSLHKCTYSTCKAVVMRKDMGVHMRQHWAQSIEGQIAIRELTFDDAQCYMAEAGLRRCENRCGKWLDAEEDEWLLPREVQAHRKVCPLQAIICPVPKCGCEFLRKDQEKHDKEFRNRHLAAEREALSIGEIRCYNGCGAMVRECDVLEHAKVCPRENVPCNIEGCAMVLPRAKMPFHMSVMHSDLATSKGKRRDDMESKDFKVGQPVEVYRDDEWYPARIEAVNRNRDAETAHLRLTFDIHYDDGQEKGDVMPDLIRRPMTLDFSSFTAICGQCDDAGLLT